MVAVKVAGRWFVKSEVEICVYCIVRVIMLII
jgi:hypothetical protein